MSYSLDTNILSAHLRRPASLGHRFFQHSGRLYTSTICLAELYVWAYACQNPSPMLTSIEELLHYEVSVIDFDRECAHHFGQMQADLRSKGIGVSKVDLLMAQEFPVGARCRGKRPNWMLAFREAEQ